MGGIRLLKNMFRYSHGVFIEEGGLWGGPYYERIALVRKIAYESISLVPRHRSVESEKLGVNDV